MINKGVLSCDFRAMINKGVLSCDFFFPWHAQDSMVVIGKVKIGGILNYSNEVEIYEASFQLQSAGRDPV
jgi:hypothetical protein